MAQHPPCDRIYDQREDSELDHLGGQQPDPSADHRARGSNAPHTAFTFRCTFPWRQRWNAEIAAVTATIPRLMAMADFGSILR